MKKVVAVILICAVVAVGGYFAFFYKSDAEKIVGSSDLANRSFDSFVNIL